MKKIYYYLPLLIMALCIIVSCHKENFLQRAEIAVSYGCVDSIETSWKYLQLANAQANANVGTSVAEMIVCKADSLYEDFLSKTYLDNAAKCLEIIEQVVACYGPMIYMPTEEIQSGISIAETRKEKLDEQKERLADLYHKQAESAQKLWLRYKNNKERERMEYSNEMAHKYNPDKY